MLTRREFLKLASMAGIGAAFADSLFVANPEKASATLLQYLTPGLDAGSIPKYVDPMVIPPAMPMAATNPTTDMYFIAVREFDQHILPSTGYGPAKDQSFPVTTVWSYGSAKHPGTFNYPAFTIEATFNKPANITWYNELVDANGNYLPHILPVDPTLHWANPPGGMKGRDTRPIFATTPDRYTGPVPIVTHVHGAHATEDSDGYPEAWYLPVANNIPKGYATTGTFYDYFNKTYNKKWAPGQSGFRYSNDQRATTLWYHDHTLGMTRLNVYAGPAGFYIIRGGPDDVVLDSRDGSPAILPGPAPTVGDDPFGKYGEIPIAIQDRSFNDDGSLFFPDTREFFDGITKYIPETEISPIWNPEFFGTTMVVNGRTWPYLEVERRRYRFRFLNGCNSRFLILDFNEIPGVGVWQIGADGGFLPAPVDINTVNGGKILLALAERADVIVDFTNVTPGKYILKNVGPDEPFGGGDFTPSDPGSTGQVMEFRVSEGPVSDPTTPPKYLQMPEITPLGAPVVTRKLSLNEVTGEVDEIEGPIEALLGTVDGQGNAIALKWMDLITENPAVGATEMWEIYNFTADAHPIHVHLVQFQVVNRQALMTNLEGEVLQPAALTGDTRLPEVWETGFKDTVIAYPGEVTRIKATFDTAGLYVWHCHIIDHEDNEMMRPYHVGPMPKGLPIK